MCYLISMSLFMFYSYSWCWIIILFHWSQIEKKLFQRFFFKTLHPNMLSISENAVCAAEKSMRCLGGMFCKCWLHSFFLWYHLMHMFSCLYFVRKTYELVIVMYWSCPLLLGWDWYVVVLWNCLHLYSGHICLES